MASDTRTEFLTYYIHSLAERTRVEKRSTKFGFDWVVYSMAIAEDLKPVRLPFFRAGRDKISTAKTETEFGIDLSFLSQDGAELTIFVLKDEPLRNTTWVANGFESDLRMAAAPSLDAPELARVERIRVVLAYNKDEDKDGLQLWENLTKALAGKVGEKAVLQFERWNLTELVERVKKSVLSPSLLPQSFFGLINYICSQVADFRHGSKEWNKQLIPNWRRFLADVLVEKTDERAVRLIPVALLIVREHGKKTPDFETGWIDLIEWAMLALWQVYQKTTNDIVKAAILQMWDRFYLSELHRFYEQHSAELSTEHSLHVSKCNSYLDAVSAAVVAHWHAARLGLLAVGFVELQDMTTAEVQRATREQARIYANWIVGLLNANPAATRPLLDIHHIELYLIWRALFQVGRKNDIANWFHALISRLLVRRVGRAMLPFIESGNNLNLVFEHVATGKRPPEYGDKSSFYQMMFLELCLSLDAKERDELINRCYQSIVQAIGSDGKPLGQEPIDIMGWQAPPNWLDRIFSGHVSDGDALTTGNFISLSEDTTPLSQKIEDFIKKTREREKFRIVGDIPEAAMILACIKYESPLPNEFWRRLIFGALKQESMTPKPA